MLCIPSGARGGARISRCSFSSMLTPASGVVAVAVSNPGPVSIVVVTHGVAGLAIVALAPGKSVVARRGWRQRRPGRGAPTPRAGPRSVASP